jgi:hypothetical protein
MIIDSQLMFSDSQAITATAASTNVIDLGTGRELGSGERLFVLLFFGTVVSNATLSYVLQGADDAAFTVNAVSILQSKTVTPLSNTYWAVPIPPSQLKRFVRLNYTLTGGTGPSIPTTATIVRDPEMHFYAAGAAAQY